MGWALLETRNGWTPGEPAYGVAQWRLDRFTVTLRGALAPGTGVFAFVVPREAAPRTVIDWVSFGVGANWESILARISISPTGEGRLHCAGVSPTRGVMLTGTYRID